METRSQSSFGFTEEVCEMWNGLRDIGVRLNVSTGWMRGSIDMDDAHLRTISVELNIAVVNVDYRFVNPLVGHPTRCSVFDDRLL